MLVAGAKTIQRRARKTATKLILAFGLVLALGSAVAAFAVVELAKVNAESVSLASDVLPSSRQAARIAFDVGAMRRLQYRDILATDAVAMDSVEAQMRKLDDTADADMSKYEATVTTDADRQIFQRVKAAWAKVQADNQRITAVARRNGNCVMGL